MDPLESTPPVAPSRPRVSRRMFFVLGGAALVLILGAAAFYSVTLTREQAAAPSGALYFAYTDEELDALPSKGPDVMHANEAFLWDEKVFRLVSKNQLPDTTASRIYAYLAIAERDTALLLEGRGNLSSISKEVLCVFFPDDCREISLEVEAGIFPEETTSGAAVAALVMEKVHARIAQEDASTRSYAIPTGDEYWSLPLPWIGYETIRWTPWFLTTHDQFRVQDIPFTDDQLSQTKAALAAVTDEQKQRTVFWAGGPGTKTPPGQWLAFADEFLKAENAPLSKVLEVRAYTTAAAADAVLAVFDSKYTYARKRPFMLDPSIQTIMPTPVHPSYPAGHSTISTAAGTVLAYYFPDRAEEIAALVEEAGRSRVWGGIHFPTDHEQGTVLGKAVGDNVLRQVRE